MLNNLFGIIWLVSGETGWDFNLLILKNSLVFLLFVEGNIMEIFIFEKEII